MRVEPLVGEPQSAVVGSAASSGRTTAPNSAPTWNPSPSSVSAATPSFNDSSSPSPRVGDEDAELVAAHPEGLPVPAGRAAQPRREPHEQRVAARMAEGVVVAS